MNFKMANRKYGSLFHLFDEFFSENVAFQHHGNMDDNAEHHKYGWLWRNWRSAIN